MKKTISLLVAVLFGLVLGGCDGGSSTPSYTVSATAGTGGAISQASAKVKKNKITSFTVMPDAGYSINSINSVSGCGGSLSGDTYTTGAVTADCTVTATFALQFIWMSGSDTRRASGVYNAPGSNVPGARTFAASWTDASGDLWLFGGYGYDSAGSWSYLNDLWEYSPLSGTWSWVSGSDTVNALGVYNTPGSNVPGARQRAATWTDASGNLWLFGGIGYDSAGTSGNLNDLWEYTPTSDTWTWVSGSDTTNASGVYNTPGSNVPGARTWSASWTDASGNLWLFGGYGYDSTGTSNRELNDLWKYDIASNTWTWMSGSDTANASGVYNTPGSNVPGARLGAVSWTDASGNLWLFGGHGYDSAGSSGALNDLWEYSPSSNTWTWKGGSDTRNANGVYGTQGVAAADNIPGGREEPTIWTDASGNLWLFGGIGLDSAGGWDDLNDLWEYDLASGEWTWMGGSDVIATSGVYGTQGTPATTNFPGARDSLAGWTDASGNFWLFGGMGYDSAGNWDVLNDLWSFHP